MAEGGGRHGSLAFQRGLGQLPRVTTERILGEELALLTKRAAKPSAAGGIPVLGRPMGATRSRCPWRARASTRAWWRRIRPPALQPARTAKLIQARDGCNPVRPFPAATARP